MAKKRRVSKQASEEPSVEPSAEQLLKIEADYNAALPGNEALLDEVGYILTERLKASDIKVHGIEKRIKALGSAAGKCKRKSFSDFKAVNDVVGARVICLFRSDLERVGELITENFEVLEVDDKLREENSPLGYLSIHYSCRMPTRYKGPRYENTADRVFEVQVRTLCMHAWAAVSHYLDYKGEWDVPDNLKRALGALSGLFYVADNEFEQFYAARLASKAKAEADPEKNAASEINLDTVEAFLESKFPDRTVVVADKEGDGPYVLSAFVQELKRSNFDSIKKIDEAIDRALDAFIKFDAEDGATGKYTAIGVARLCLSLVSDQFYEACARSASFKKRNKVDPLLAYRSLVKK
jgi:putative GTP pyrophosphokinase